MFGPIDKVFILTVVNVVLFVFTGVVWVGWTRRFVMRNGLSGRAYRLHYLLGPFGVFIEDSLHAKRALDLEGLRPWWFIVQQLLNLYWVVAISGGLLVGITSVLIHRWGQ